MRLPTAILAALSNNSALPALPIWQARSFYAQILLIVSVLLNAFGIDLFGVLADIGWGSTPEEVIATGDRAVAAWQQIAPLVFGLWAWIERRAPSYRLVWPWSARSAIAAGSSALAIVMLMGLAHAAVPMAGASGPLLLAGGAA